MRKRIAFVVATLIAACLWQGRLAYAGYDARVSELREVLKKKELRDDKEREVLTKALDEYVKNRQECLDALVRIIEQTTLDKQESAWLYRIDGCKEDVARFGNSVKSIPGTPSIGAFNFVAIAQIEEVNFFLNLAKTKVGERRDRIVINGKNVEDMKGKLEEKWRYLTDQDNSLDESEKRVAEQINAMIERAKDESDRLRRTIKEQLAANAQVIAKYTKQYGKPVRELLLDKIPGDVAQALKVAIEGIEKVAESVNAYTTIYLKTNADYIARYYEFGALMQSERGGVFVLFSEFRRDTEEFLKTNGFEQAKIDYQAARDAFATWASSAATSPQRSDAESFAKDVLAKLTNHLSATETKFNEFVSKHRGKFFGPKGPDIEESLLETRVWEDWNRMIQGKGLDSQLRQWRNEANTFFTVSLSELSSADQEYLPKLIRDRTDTLARALEEAEKIPEKIRKDFDRSRLKDDLK